MIGEEFTCTGEWWVPDENDPQNPKRIHTGTLTFSHGKGIVLDIMGQLESDELAETASPFAESSFEMIWGKSTVDELITLYHCRWAGGSFGAFPSTSYLISTVFASKDVWFTPQEKIAFKSLYLDYTLLDEWIGESAIRRHTEFIDGKLKVDVSGEAIDKLPRVNVGDYIISTYVGVGIRGTRVPRRAEIIEQAPRFYIESSAFTEIPLDAVYKVARGLQNFLSLLMYDEAIYPLVIEGSVAVEGDTAKSAIVRLLYEQTGTRKTSNKLGNILFSLKDVEDVWEDALCEMILADEDHLKPVLDQFFAEHYSPAPFVEDRFMTTIRTIEAFHRRTCKRDYYVEESEYKNTLFKEFFKPVKEAVKEVDLPGNLRDSFRDSLRSRLEYGYQYSLRKRLHELLDSPIGEEFLTLFVATEEEREKLKTALEALEEQEKEQQLKQWIKKQRHAFVETTVKTRNWYTHFDQRDKPQAVTDGPLAFLNLKLRLFTAALLLAHIHVPSEEVKSKFQDYKFSYLARN
jgi:hypothetical protein